MKASDNIKNALIRIYQNFKKIENMTIKPIIIYYVIAKI